MKADALPASTAGWGSPAIAGGKAPSVLLLSEYCNPGWVSLPLVGWGHARALSHLVRVHLVTQAYNRENISKEGVPDDAVTYVENRVGTRIVEALSSVFRRDQQIGWTSLTAMKVPEYYLFEYLVWRTFQSRLRAREFDVVHRLTPMTPVQPSYIAHKCRQYGIPFVAGPFNGGLPWPKEMGERMGRERDRLSRLRGLYTLLPLTRSTRRDAAAILLAGRHALQDVPAAYRDKCLYLPEVGFFPERMTTRRQGPVRLPLRIAAVGRMVALKGFDLLLRAAAPLIRDGTVAIELIGSGPEEARLKQIAAEERVEAGLTFHGWVENRRVPQLLSTCDVFGFPSLKELGGGAVVEAMAVGLVPIVVNYGGPGEVVRDDFGFRVPLGSEDAIVRDLREVLARLVADPSQVELMRDRARAYAFEHFAYEAKARKTAAVYEWVIDPSRGRPDLPFPD